MIVLYCSVVSVGGDGTCTEIVHGLMERQQQEVTDSAHPAFGVTPSSLPLRIGIIPAGSTNTIVWSLQGCSDPRTAALHVIIGLYL